MARPNDLPTMLASQPIVDALTRTEERIALHLEWDGPDAASVRTARWMVAEMYQALQRAAEHWATTADTVRATGWDTQTILRYARMKRDGERLPFLWRHLECRRGPDGYSFKLSTVPVKSGGAE